MQKRSAKLDKAGTHALCVRLMALVLSVAFSVIASSCANLSGWVADWTDGRSGTPDKIPFVANSNMIRLITSCLSDSGQIETVYHSFPEKQLDGLSLAEFSEYVGILSRLGEGKGRLSSFRVFDESEILAIRETLTERLPNQEELIEQSVPVQLTYESETGGDSSIVYVQENEDGSLYLDADWVRQCIELYRFSKLYYTAVQNQNTDAVYSMLQNSYHDRDYSFSNETIRLKARELSRFYLLRVKAEFEQYQMTVADISSIVFDQKGVLDDELLNYESRSVTIRRDPSGSIVVNDVLTDTLKVRDLYLYADDNRTIRIGDYSNNAYFESLFGQPLLTTVSRSGDGEAVDDPAEPKFDLIVDYPSARIYLHGSIDSIGAWEGIVTRIHIKSGDSDFSIGKVIRVGMTLDDFMKIYPFADETDFVLSVENDEQSYRLKIRLAVGNGDKVSGIILEAE